MRRVSWSETHFVSEHFYPKYDYSDYDDIEQENEELDSPATTPMAKKNLGLSHRVHPSLRPTNTSDDPYSYSFTSPTSPRSTAPNSSLSSFVPKTISSYTPQYTAEDHSPMTNGGSPVSHEPLEQNTDDFYADLTSNTAALLW